MTGIRVFVPICLVFIHGVGAFTTYKVGYLSDAKYWNVRAIVTCLVENDGKNGNLLLNFPPRADGTIPEEQVNLLPGIGKWLELNGGAIYETKAWK